MHKSRYIPLTQQPFCCMPASVQMVLLKQKLPLLSQEDIGYDIGLIVPKSYKKLLPGARTGKMPPSGWGTQERKYPLNNFFRKYGIPLRSQFLRPSEIQNVGQWIEENIKKGNDILACFNYGLLYGGKGRGHVSVVESISDNDVMLIDPSRRNVPKYRKVKLARLLAAMERHPTGGFHLITAKKKRYVKNSDLAVDAETHESHIGCVVFVWLSSLSPIPHILHSIT